MKVKVMFHSKSGNTKKIAQAIAEELKVTAENVPPSYPLENVDVLFLGTGVYAGDVDVRMKEFIRTLDVKRAKNVAVFGTYGGKDTGILKVKELLQGKGINVIEDTFGCKGRAFFFMNRKHPNQQDLDNAKAFAAKVVKSMEK